jgi:hypothetical protein
MNNIVNASTYSCSLVTCTGGEGLNGDHEINSGSRFDNHV